MLPLECQHYTQASVDVVVNVILIFISDYSSHSCEALPFFSSRIL